MNKLSSIEFSKILDEDLIELDVPVSDKEEAIHYMVGMLYKKGYILDKTEFYNSVISREKEGVTGLGNGIAIPHGKSESVKTTSLSIIRTFNPIKWESLDEEDVSVLILFAVKDNDAETVHIKLLQKVASLLADDNILNSIKGVSTKKELLDIFTINEKEERLWKLLELQLVHPVLHTRI